MDLRGWLDAGLDEGGPELGGERIADHEGLGSLEHRRGGRRARGWKVIGEA
jgi:hypothetical protein